jgi:hypothetical protein
MILPHIIARYASIQTLRQDATVSPSIKPVSFNL